MNADHVKLNLKTSTKIGAREGTGLSPGWKRYIGEKCKLGFDLLFVSVFIVNKMNGDEIFFYFPFLASCSQIQKQESVQGNK